MFIETNEIDVYENYIHWFDFAGILKVYRSNERSCCFDSCIHSDKDFSVVLYSSMLVIFGFDFSIKSFSLKFRSICKTVSPKFM